MEKKIEEKMRAEGYELLDTYINNEIKCGMTEDDSMCGSGTVPAIGSALTEESAEQMLKAVRRYEEASEKFHSVDGDGYYIARKCLQNYLDYKFIQENNHFRFEDREDDFSGGLNAEAFISAGICRSKESGCTGPETSAIMTGTQADIYYLLYQAEQTSAASRRCREYTESRRLHLTAVLVRLLERTVTSLENSQVARYREYGRLLRIVYMEKQYAETEVADLLKILGYGKKQYYRIRSEAISFLSRNLFGIFAGETGMAELYIGEDEIIIPSIRMKKIKKIEKET